MSTAKRKTAKTRTSKTSAAKAGKAKSRTRKTGASKTGAAKQGAAKARALDQQEPACEAELNLARFLIDLAIDQDVRAAFIDNSKAAMEKASLSKEAITAIDAGKQNDLLRLICVSQQNT